MKLSNFDVMMIGVFDVCQGLARIFSFGYWQPGWHCDYVGWKLKRWVRKMKNE